MQQLDLFKQAISNNRLSHLYLLSGPKGSGKERLVFDVIYEIFKTKENENILKEQIENQKLLNISYIKPDGLSIKKGQIAELQEEFSKTSLVDGYRIYVIYNAELMTVSAANSLLKFLEEPENDKTLGFLLTNNEDVILPTIISRSQIVHMPKIDVNVIIYELTKNEVDQNLAFYIAHITKDVDEAISFSKNEEVKELHRIVMQVFNDFSDKNKISLLLIDQKPFILQSREQYQTFLDGILLYLYDAIKISYQIEPIIEENKKIYHHLLTSIGVDKINKTIEQIKELIKEQMYYVNNELSLIRLSIILKECRWLNDSIISPV